jgi:DNA-binding GntR family transcriptional regulator
MSSGLKRKHGSQRYVRLNEYLMQSAAWQALDGNCRGLYIELARRYRGPNSNNGKIPYSVREAADHLRIGKTTANRCFDRLQETGFVKIGKRSGFSVKGRVATEWLLTEFPDDASSNVPVPATKDFLRWAPQNSEHSPTTGTHSPTTGTDAHLRRDTAA